MEIYNDYDVLYHRQCTPLREDRVLGIFAEY